MAVAIAVWTTCSKARDAGTAILSGPGRRFVYSFAPPIFVGVLLTLVLVRAGPSGVPLLVFLTSAVGRPSLPAACFPYAASVH